MNIKKFLAVAAAAAMLASFSACGSGEDNGSADGDPAGVTTAANEEKNEDKGDTAAAPQVDEPDIDFVEPPVEEFTYEKSGENTYWITSYTGSASDIVIPNEINGIPVVSVYLKGNETITSIKISEGVVVISEDGFNGCKNLRYVSLPSTIIRIDEQAFCDCPIESINLPSSLVEIKDHAFSGTALTSITIPENVESIGNGAFGVCENLTSVTFLSNKLNKLLTIFPNCQNLTDVNLPEGLTELSGTFHGCSSLEKIVIPETVVHIYGAFDGCSSLREINLPEEIQEIEDGSFKGCSSLTHITYPDSFNNGSFNSHQEKVFEGCDNLTVTFKGVDYNKDTWSELDEAIKNNKQ